MDKQIQRLSTLLLDGPGSGVPISQLREDFSQFYLSFQKGAPPMARRAQKCPVPAYFIGEEPSVEPGRVVVFFHGGGFIYGSTRDHLDLCARLAQAARARVLSVDYRLAPEHPFPAAVHDAFAAYAWILETGIKASCVTLAGISAGGTLALCALEIARRNQTPFPGAVVCMSPVANMEFDGAAIYLAGQDPRQPLASPLFADMSGWPPLLIQAGSLDIWVFEAQDLAKKAVEQGVDVTLEVWDNMVHCWQMFASTIPDGGRAIQRIGDFILARAPGKESGPR